MSTNREEVGQQSRKEKEDKEDMPGEVSMFVVYMHAAVMVSYLNQTRWYPIECCKL